MISADGFVKILDFGLAKLIPKAADDTKTAVKQDTTGAAILGTAGYMSPEQASGAHIDFRSDQFALGTILYEMASGVRPFRRDTTAETLTAIIREDPKPLSQINPGLPPPLRWVIERCLTKEAEDRYASTKDLARDLKSIRDHLSDSDVVAPSRVPPRRTAATAAAILVAIAFGALMFFAGTRAGKVVPPSFHQLTFRRGLITSARFAPDGRIIYAAAWDGTPARLFENQGERPDARELGLADADILAISPSGRMAVTLDSRISGPFIRAGTLAELNVGASGAPRKLMDNIREADWSPDEKEMMIVRDVGGSSRIEMPAGRVLYQSAGWIGSARVSRDGSEIAFVDHALLSDDGGTVCIVGRGGKKRTLSKTYQSVQGLAWSPDNSEVWVTASEGGLNRYLLALDRSGKERVLVRAGGLLTLQDVSADGRVAIKQDIARIRVFGYDGKEERDLTWFDWTLLTDVSKDGKQITFTEAGEGGGDGYSVFIRSFDGSPAVRLGEGARQTISPDGQFVAAIVESHTKGEVVLYPTGVGPTRRIATPSLNVQLADWTPDGRQLLITANEAGRGTRLYRQDVAGGTARPISGEGFRQFTRTVSPDGRWVAAAGPDHKIYLHPLTGSGAPRLLATLVTGDTPTGWNAGGTALYVYNRAELPTRVYLLDVQTGAKTLWKEYQPSERAGIVDASRIFATPDGSRYASLSRQQLSDLFVLRGVK
jgi:Tol biopolymer transport system component